MIKSGSCGGASISTKSECDAAATALDLSDKSARDYTSVWRAYYPPGCQFTVANWGNLYVYGPSSYGPCTASRRCICKFISPLPPPPPPPWPLPPPPPPS
eukprot:scaffold61884_cov48-Phaeocystis_antarctica.AAC.1